MTKTCKVCKTDYQEPEKHFYKQARSKDGLYVICKKCSVVRNKAYYKGVASFCYDTTVKELKFWVEKNGQKLFKHDKNLYTI